MAPLRLIHLPAELQSIIAEHLSPHDLCQLVASCKAQYNAGIRSLYRRNSREDHSSAIARTSIHSSESTAIKVMHISLAHGGNVNAMIEFPKYTFTALHVAAARGFRKLAALLLKNGASFLAEARDFHLLVPEITDLATLPNLEPMFEMPTWRWPRPNLYLITFVKWLPLLVPYLRRDARMIQLLIDAGAPSHLTERVSQPRTPLNPQAGCVNTSFTMLHAAIILKLDVEVRLGLKRNPEDISTHMVKCLQTPLHLAVSLSDARLVQTLIDSRPQLDAYDSFGNAPLHVAIEQCSRAPLTIRKAQPAIAKALIHAGTDVNIRRATHVAETPLIHLASRIRHDWNESRYHIKAMFNVLVENGGDLNRMANEYTVLGWLHLAIVTRRPPENSLAIQALFKNLLDKGADINLFVHASPTSLLGRTMPHHRLKKVTKRLIDLGARLNYLEVATPLLKWTEGEELPGGYDILQHGEEIGQELAQKACKNAFYHGELERFEEIQRRLSFTPDYNRIVAGFLYSDYTRFLTLPRMDFSIDINYYSHGCSFLHLMVRKLHRSSLADDDYTESDAVQDAMVFLKRGVLPDMPDSNGKSAMQLLEEQNVKVSQIKFSKLQNLLRWYISCGGEHSVGV